MLRMKLLSIVIAMLAVPYLHAQTPPPTVHVIRQHSRVVMANDNVYEWSELVFSGDVAGIVTLWRGASGEMLIFRESEVFTRGTMNYSISDPRRNLFLQGVLRLPYGGRTPAEAKRALNDVPAEAYETSPFVMGIGHFRATAAFRDWHSAAGAEHRNELRGHIADGTLRMMKKNLVTASSVGSVAAGAVCFALIDIIAEGNSEASCHHDRRVTAEISAADCDFDAKFGYPCETVH